MENTNQKQNQQEDASKKDQQQNQQAGEEFNTDGGLKKSDTSDVPPDSTNQSTGVMGSGQRQDSN